MATKWLRQNKKKLVKSWRWCAKLTSTSKDFVKKLHLFCFQQTKHTFNSLLNWEWISVKLLHTISWKWRQLLRERGVWHEHLIIEWDPRRHYGKHSLPKKERRMPIATGRFGVKLRCLVQVKKKLQQTSRQRRRRRRQPARVGGWSEELPAHLSGQTLCGQLLPRLVTTTGRTLSAVFKRYSKGHFSTPLQFMNMYFTHTHTHTYVTGTDRRTQHANENAKRYCYTQKRKWTKSWLQDHTTCLVSFTTFWLAGWLIVIVTNVGEYHQRLATKHTEYTHTQWAAVSSTVCSSTAAEATSVHWCRQKTAVFSPLSDVRSVSRWLWLWLWV